MKARIVMMIHDAIWVEAPDDEGDQVRHLVWRMMPKAGMLKVPLEVDIDLLTKRLLRSRHFLTSGDPLLSHPDRGRACSP